MSEGGPTLVVVGGFPGSGKSVVARRLARTLSVPRLCSDTTGGAVRRAMPDSLASGEAFRAGYEVLFTLAEEFLRDGCSVVADLSMGWDFQWHRVDAIARAVPEATVVPVILQCPYEVCVERVRSRHAEAGDDPAATDRFMAQPQLPGVWAYLEDLDRHDVVWVDGDQEPQKVYRDVVRDLEMGPGGPV